MRTSIEYANSYALLVAELDPGEAIKAEPGAMVAQRGVDLKTGMGRGGMMGGLRRMVSGESFFINTFTGGPNGGQVHLAPATPGDIRQFSLPRGQNLFIQASSFLACTGNVQLDTKFQGIRGIFSGESIFFIRAYDDGPEPGTVYYDAYGAIMELNVFPGETLSVDTGHLVAFGDDVSYTIGKVGGLGSLVMGGEGLVMHFTGNGRVWIQTRKLESLLGRLMPFLAKAKHK